MQDINARFDGQERRLFMQAVLRDLRALERLLQEDRIESGVNRIGAEQELVIVGRDWRPAPLCEEILEELEGDPHFTHELGRFNIEFNLDPLSFSGDCLSKLERRITEFFDKTRYAAHRHDAEAMMVGILPSLEKDDLSLRNLTDRPRYWALNEALNNLRGGKYELRIKGRDELIVTHDSVMLEACNTSFQVHFQVSPQDFATKYNAAQAVAGPVMAAAANSPLLFGKRLWQESRIALFQQSVDTRKAGSDLRDFPPRVSFGHGWVRESVLEIYKEDLARFKPLFSTEADEDPMQVIDRGEAPNLRCLMLHNGTVYRWNRPCYGTAIGPDGKRRAHIRIENRILPSGPTPMDEVANAAFWFGLMRAIVDEQGNMADHMPFDDAASNFVEAATHGLDAQFDWPGMGQIPARELIALRLLPMARRGLQSAGIDADDIDRYLEIIELRVGSGRTGARWMLDSVARLNGTGTRAERMAVLSEAVSINQVAGRPVHEWPSINTDQTATRSSNMRSVGQIMTTDLFTVHESDVIDFAASLMDWQHVRHIPVEDDDHNLVGLVSHRAVLRHLARLNTDGRPESVPVSAIMSTEIVTATPSTPTIEAIELMRRHSISCLPVVREEKLVGILTEHDIVLLAEPLLRRFLSDDPPSDPLTELTAD
ncbi:MAG: CBS domain-containing protein [bacterium]|nr:CBS domain-containing protein [bacterium]